MGRLCIECNTYQPQKRVITITGKPAHKATDVIAVELGCGHTVGEEDYTNYMKDVNVIEADILTKKLALDKERKNKLSGAYAKLKATKEGGK